MKRSAFIKDLSTAVFFPFFLNALSACNKTKGGHKRIFVIIQLEGGNDGLNTLIPLDNYKKFVEARPNLFIPENKIVTLKGIPSTGLHPALEGIRDLYNDNLIRFVQGVGYENSDYSHFRSSDIWLTGSDASTVLYTGWMARFLETKYKNYPHGFPNLGYPSPPAIKIGETGTYLFQGTEMDMSIVIDAASDFDVSDINNVTSKLSSTLAGQRIKSINDIELQARHYSGVIKNALASSFTHSKLYPKTGTNSLADQLKVVAKLIAGGLETSVYMVGLKGFDTHDEQVNPSNTTQGIHADLLKQISQSITCFWDDIKRMGRQDDVAGMAFSEFGRRIMSNASYGTDHGSSQPLLFFGAGLTAGITGKNPVLPEKPNSDDNLEMQYDFRAVYSSIIKKWMRGSDADLKQILPGDFAGIEIFNS